MNTRPFINLVLVWICFSLRLEAQGLPVPSTEVTLKVWTKNDQTTFQVGEIIPLQLAFTSSVPQKYLLNMAAYDRSGRMNYERFEISPSTWRDPAAAYFQSWAGFLGGGITNFQPLSQVPTMIALDLNEWRTFDSPGTYRVRVASNRAFAQDRTTGRGIEVPSNELELTIVEARPEWQAAVLEEALKILEPIKERTSIPDSALRSVKTLRYLGTRAASREMARRLQGFAWDLDFMLGLIGSPRPSETVLEMERFLSDPDFGVTSRFLTTLAITSVASQNIAPSVAARTAAETRYREQLMSALASKRGAALANSISTVFETPDAAGQSTPAAVKRSLSASLASNFDTLPAGTQFALLESRWRELDPAAMLPILPGLARRTPSVKFGMEAVEINGVSGAALKRWYEAAPDEARAAVVEEILRPEPRFGLDVLGILKDESLPEAESLLLQHLEQSWNRNLDATNKISALLARYGTGAIQTRVVSLLDSILGKGACELQGNLLAYVIKVQPKAARPRLETALAARGSGFSGCYRTLFSDLSRLGGAPVLEELAANGLSDNEPRVVADAADYLRRYGGASREELLWTKFGEWNRRRQGANPSTEEYISGFRMLSALAEGQAWHIGPDTLQRLAELTAGWDDGQRAIERYQLYNRQISLEMPVREDPFYARIAQYELRSPDELRARIAKLPSGTVLVWPDRPSLNDLFSEFSSFARERGVTIQRASPR